MKVLDAEQLHAGIQETITVLLQLKKQLEQIEQNLQSFISLEGELKGKVENPSVPSIKNPTCHSSRI